MNLDQMSATYSDNTMSSTIIRPTLNQLQCRALTQLKQDSSRVVLTADKGVAMVIMDQQDYTNKAQALQETNTYKIINKDPTNRLKKCSGTSNKQEVSSTVSTNNCILPVLSLPNSMAFPKYTKLIPLSGP